MGLTAPQKQSVQTLPEIFKREGICLNPAPVSVSAEDEATYEWQEIYFQCPDSDKALQIVECATEHGYEVVELLGSWKHDSYGRFGSDWWLIVYRLCD